MKRMNKRGVVLVWALVMMAVATTILGAMCSYYTGVGHVADYYIRQMTADSYSRRTRQSGENETQKTFSDAQKIVDFLSNNATAETKKDTEKNEYQTKTVVKVAEKEIASEKLKEKIVALGTGETLEIVKETTTYNSRAGGVEVKSTYRETYEVTKRTDDEKRSDTCPVFNYLYFTDNYGRLDSSYIIANGDVGANNDFTLSGATVNGFVNSSKTVYLNNSPKAWPRSSYLAKVAAEYELNGKYFFMPTRPTDPIIGTANDTLYETPWEGGYDPILPVNATYGGTADNPSGTGPDDPGPEPTFDGVKPSCSDDKYNWPSGSPTYNSWYGKWYYDGSYYTSEDDAFGAYIADNEDEPESSDYTWPSAPTGPKTKTTGSGKSKKTTYYYLYNGKEYTGKSKDAARNSAYEAYNNDTADVQAQFDADKAKHEQFMEVYGLYEDDLDDYTESQLTWKANVYDPWKTQKELYDAYQKWISTVSSSEYEEPITKTSITEAGKLVVNEYTNTVDGLLAKVPDLLSDASKRVEYCKNYEVSNAVGTVKGGTLTCLNKDDYGTAITCEYEYQYVKRWGNVSRSWNTPVVLKCTEGSCTCDPMSRQLAEVRVTGGEAGNICPFVANDTYYSKVDSLKETEQGSVILIGTRYYPITINGPVYVNGDVIIRGFVSGRGTIYAGRNIHIIGDVTYLNPPSWPHSASQLAEAGNTPEKVAASNKTTDKLQLMARGNIIVGDYTATVWTNASQMAYLKTTPTEQSRSVNGLDSDIGYGTFNGDYTALDSSATDGGAICTLTPEDDYYGTSNEDRLLLVYLSKYYYYKYRPAVTTGTRKFYESKLGDWVIQGLKQSESATDTSKRWRWPSSAILRWIFGYYSSVQSAVAANTDSGDITEIDALLFANHGIFGVVGGSTSKKFTLNGAMICRDEGLLPSFANRFKNDSSARAWLNWDMRIPSTTAEGDHSGLPEEDNSYSETITYEVKLKSRSYE